MRPPIFIPELINDGRKFATGRKGGDFGATAKVQFAQDSADVVFDSFGTDHQAFRNVTIGQTQRNQGGNFRFSPGEGFLRS